MNPITSQQIGLKRTTTEKFYTKENVVNLCIDAIKTHIDILNTDLIIEPSAGNGAFIEKIKTITNNFQFFDIEPDNPKIVKLDFLNYTPTNNGTTHVIGNPPFGRQSTMAIKFIKKCCEFAKTISFILPKSFKKNSMQKHFTNNYHLIYSIDLPEKSFVVNGVEHDVPCIFQIWQKQNNPREQIIKETPNNFQFVTVNDNPDISFRRVGINAGMISTSFADKSPQSHYFIKFTNGILNDNLEKLKNITFEHNNTVGPKSISKNELTMEFNKFI